MKVGDRRNIAGKIWVGPRLLFLPKDQVFGNLAVADRRQVNVNVRVGILEMVKPVLAYVGFSTVEALERL